MWEGWPLVLLSIRRIDVWSSVFDASDGQKKSDGFVVIGSVRRFIKRRFFCRFAGRRILSSFVGRNGGPTSSRVETSRVESSRVELPIFVWSPPLVSNLLIRRPSRWSGRHLCRRRPLSSSSSSSSSSTNPPHIFSVQLCIYFLCTSVLLCVCACVCLVGLRARARDFLGGNALKRGGFGRLLAARGGAISRLLL